MKLTKDRALDLNPFIHRQLLAALRDLERIR